MTKSIIKWLMDKEWTIMAYDYPQSGTGRCLHPNFDISKTEGIWIPDIIAHKNHDLIFFENKNRLVASDFEKIFRIKSTDNYSNSIQNLSQGFSVERVYYGVGFYPQGKDLEKAEKYKDKIDFLVSVVYDGRVMVEFDPARLFE